MFALVLRIIAIMPSCTNSLTSPACARSAATTVESVEVWMTTEPFPVVSKLVWTLGATL